MIEAGAAEISDDKMFEAIMLAHEEIKKLCAFIEDIQAQIGKPKFSYPPPKFRRSFSTQFTISVQKT